MELGKVYTDGVIIGERQRHLDDAKVSALAESMAAIGLQQPISIWADGDEPHLVAGRHRLAAALKLGWDEIDCIFVGLNEIDRQIWEIDENLYRAELTTDEMREHLRRRKGLWEQRQQNIGTLCPEIKKPVGRPKSSFAQETAAATGLSARHINRLIADPKQLPVATTVQPKDTCDIDEFQLKTLQSAWNRSGDRARAAFLEWIETQETPVFDRASA